MTDIYFTLSEKLGTPRHALEAALADAGFRPPHVKEPEIAGGDGTVRKAHYGSGVQPWDLIIKAGWGPQFAAANALKYVRRAELKNGEDDLEKGRWYMARLDEMVAAEVKKWGAGIKGPAHYARDDLLCIITRPEHRLLLNTQEPEGH